MNNNYGRYTQLDGGGTTMVFSLDCGPEGIEIEQRFLGEFFEELAKER